MDDAQFERHPLMHEYAYRCAQRNTAEYQTMYLQFARYFGDEIGGAYQRAVGANDPMPALLRIDAEIDNVELAQKRSSCLSKRARSWDRPMCI